MGGERTLFDGLYSESFCQHQMTLFSLHCTIDLSKSAIQLYLFHKFLVPYNIHIIFSEGITPTFKKLSVKSR
jgi:hypothetical protein